MIDRIVHAVCTFAGLVLREMGRERVIIDREGRTPYLSRYYILGLPKMRDGSSPFDKQGQMKKAVEKHSPPISVFLHHFHRGDDDGALHSHPWKWGVSWILTGGYVEERRLGSQKMTRFIAPGMLNFLSKDDFHRVVLAEKDAWSLFVAGPKFASWGFWDEKTNEVVPWREWIYGKRERDEYGGVHVGSIVTSPQKARWMRVDKIKEDGTAVCTWLDDSGVVGRHACLLSDLELVALDPDAITKLAKSIP
jgi:hypothetical protein